MKQSPSRIHNYVYVTTWSTVDYTSVTMCESSFDLQFSLSDTSENEKNAVNVKDKASNERYLYHPSPRL